MLLLSHSSAAEEAPCKAPSRSISPPVTPLPEVAGAVVTSAALTEADLVAVSFAGVLETAVSFFGVVDEDPWSAPSNAAKPAELFPVTFDLVAEAVEFAFALDVLFPLGVMVIPVSPPMFVTSPWSLVLIPRSPPMFVTFPSALVSIPSSPPRLVLPSAPTAMKQKLELFKPRLWDLRSYVLVIPILLSTSTFGTA